MANAGQIRVGMIGTGFAASSHVDALRRVPGVEIAAIAGRTPERAAEGAAALAIDRPVDDWRRLLDDDGIDAVHNCTPNVLHAEINAAALEAGKHLLSEKPLAMDAGQTAELAQRAAAAGVVSGVCFNYRHFPLVEEARGLMAGEVGPPHLIRGGYLQDWLLADTDWNWRLDSSTAGPTRAVGDIGSHWIDLIQHVTGRRLARVYARLGRLHGVRRRPAAVEQTFGRAADAGGKATEVDTEDFATTMFELDDGCPGVFTVSQVTPGMRNRLSIEIDARAACLSWDQERPNRLWIGRRDGPNRELVRDPALLSEPAARLVHYPAGHQEGWP
ncbi:MAG TPA: Gfo/Idh/MocA family oxidoreductase, partial [Gaiellales bacterium]|nr:Gfo/Idh/MocA family oxidoreductase [Gaiellales bacterium]